MSNDVAMTVEFAGGDPLVEFPADNTTVTIPLTPLGDRLYRLDGVPVLIDAASFGDVIEAETIAEGRFRFVRVVEPGGWRTFMFILPRHKIDSEWGQLLLRELEARGGHWERVFGGLLFVCIPPGLDLDPTPWVETT